MRIKLVENAIAQILEQIYEPKFYDESYGFRPSRNCHKAVKKVVETVRYQKTNYVVEADIRGFFDNVNHEWLMKMLAHDIADKKIPWNHREISESGNHGRRQVS